MMKRILLDSIQLEITQGNIVQQPDIDVIVNAANAYLKPGGGVAGAIHRAAGHELEQECQQYAPIKPGEAVITKGYRLPNPYVIHVLGPIYGQDKPEDKLLANCYRHALLLADEKGLRSIAFPAISTGAFGYPLQEAAQVALQAVRGTVAQLNNVRLIRFVLFDKTAVDAFEHALEDIA